MYSLFSKAELQATLNHILQAAAKNGTHAMYANTIAELEAAIAAQ